MTTPSMAQTPCRLCGAPFPTGAAYCKKCGASAPTAVTSNDRGSTQRRGPTDIGAHTAPHTGTSPSAAGAGACAVCGTPLRVGAAFCRECGASAPTAGPASRDKTGTPAADASPHLQPAPATQPPPGAAPRLESGLQPLVLMVLGGGAVAFIVLVAGAAIDDRLAIPSSDHQTLWSLIWVSAVVVQAAAMIGGVYLDARRLARAGVEVRGGSPGTWAVLTALAAIVVIPVYLTSRSEAVAAASMTAFWMSALYPKAA